MNPRQVTLLYGIGGIVLLGALSALSWVELRQLHKLEQETVAARDEVDRLSAEIDARPAQVARAAALEAALATKRRLLPREVDAQAVYDRLLGLRRKHALAELVITASRDEQLGLWPAEAPAAYVPPSSPWIRPWTCYVGVTGHYAQILAFMNDVEQVDTIQLVRDLVLVRAQDPAPGAIPLRAGFSLTLYAGPPNAAPAPPLSAQESRELLGAAHALGRAVDDDWAAKGLDWRTTPPEGLPARNPFDPYPALTRATPLAPALDLNALERRFSALVNLAATTGDDFEAIARAVASELGTIAPGDRAQADRWTSLRARLSALEAAVGRARSSLAEQERERAAIEALAADHVPTALSRLAALTQVLEAEAGAPLAAHRSALASRTTALRAQLEGAAPAVIHAARARLTAMNSAAVAGDLSGLATEAQALVAVAASHPASTELAGVAREAQDLADRAERLTALVSGLRFTGTVVANGVNFALVGGRRYRPGDSITVEGEALSVVDLDDARLVLEWRGLRATRQR